MFSMSPKTMSHKCYPWIEDDIEESIVCDLFSFFIHKFYAEVKWWVTHKFGIQYWLYLWWKRVECALSLKL